MELPIGWLGHVAADVVLDGPGEFLLRSLLVALLAALPLLVFLPRVIRRRRLWCGVQYREVEVEFEENGPPGLRQPTNVRSCSAFDPPTAVACERWCLDATCRRQWADGVRASTR